MAMSTTPRPCRPWSPPSLVADPTADQPADGWCLVAPAEETDLGPDPYTRCLALLRDPSFGLRWRLRRG